jgi:hypothetical protein
MLFDMRNILIETSSALPWFKIDDGDGAIRCGKFRGAYKRYKVKKPVKKAIFDFGIADSGLNILNPHKRGPVGDVGAVGIPLLWISEYKQVLHRFSRFK